MSELEELRRLAIRLQMEQAAGRNILEVLEGVLKRAINEALDIHREAIKESLRLGRDVGNVITELVATDGKHLNLVIRTSTRYITVNIKDVVDLERALQALKRLIY